MALAWGCWARPRAEEEWCVEGEEADGDEVVKEEVEELEEGEDPERLKEDAEEAAGRVGPPEGLGFLGCCCGRGCCCGFPPRAGALACWIQPLSSSSCLSMAF